MPSLPHCRLSLAPASAAVAGLRKDPYPTEQLEVLRVRDRDAAVSRFGDRLPAPVGKRAVLTQGFHLCPAREIGAKSSRKIVTAPAPDDSVRALSGAGVPIRHRQNLTVAAGCRAR